MGTSPTSYLTPPPSVSIDSPVKHSFHAATFIVKAKGIPPTRSSTCTQHVTLNGLSATRTPFLLGRMRAYVGGVGVGVRVRRMVLPVNRPGI